MNIENGLEVIKPDKPESSSQKNGLEELSEKMKHHLGVIFDENLDGPSRVNIVLNIIKYFLDGGLIPEDQVFKIREAVLSSSKIVDRTEFVNFLRLVLDPLLVLSQVEKKKFEERHRKVFIEQGGYIPTNENLIFSYGLDDGEAHIHLAPARTMAMKEVLREVERGLKILAEKVKNDPRVKLVSATSWIVAKSPALLERLGFTIEGLIDKKKRQEHYSDESRPVARATMSREVLLKKYLEGDN